MTAMERLLYLVRETGVEFQVRPCPVASGVVITLSLPNVWRYTAQRMIADRDLANANVPADDVIRRAVDELEQQLRKDGTDASHGREPQKAERLARGYGYRGVSPIQFYTSLMGPGQLRREMEVIVVDDSEPRYYTRAMDLHIDKARRRVLKRMTPRIALGGL